MASDDEERHSPGVWERCTRQPHRLIIYLTEESNQSAGRGLLALPDQAVVPEPVASVTRGRARPGRPQGSNASSSILRAAKRLFLNAGFDGVSLEAVGEAAGVTRQTVYNLFGSKEGVFRAMVGLHWDEIARDSAIVQSTSLAIVLEPAAILRDFGAAIVRFIEGTEQVAFTRLVIMESRQRPWIAEEFYLLRKQPLLHGFTDCLRRLDAAGSISCMYPEIAAHQFFGLIQEFVIWPQVMAIGPAAQAMPASSLVIDEAVLTFLSRYERSEPPQGPPTTRPVPDQRSGGENPGHIKRQAGVEDEQPAKRQARNRKSSKRTSDERASQKRLPPRAG